MPYPSDRLYPAADAWPGAPAAATQPPPAVAPALPDRSAPSRMRDRWSFVIGPATGGLSTDLAAATGRKVTFKRTAPHEASCSLRGNDRAAAEIVELATDLHIFRRPGPGRPRERLFRGRIGKSSDSIDETSHTVTVPALDYRAVLGRRALMSGSQVTWTQTDQAAIAMGLITQAQNKPGGDYGITPRVGASTGVLRDRTFKLGDIIGPTIQELSEVENGFDWEITPVDDAGLVLDIYYPQRGTDRGVVLEVGGGATTLQREVDSGAFANAIRMTGQAPEGGGTEPPPYERPAPGTGFTPVPPEGRWDAVIGSSLTTAAAISERVDWQLGESQTVRPSYTMTLRPGWWGGPEHVWLGDPVQIVVYRGRLRVDTVLRVEEISVDIGGDGGEQVTVTVGAPRPDYRRRATDIERRLAELERR